MIEVRHDVEVDAEGVGGLLLASIWSCLSCSASSNLSASSVEGAPYNPGLKGLIAQPWSPRPRLARRPRREAIGSSAGSDREQSPFAGNALQLMRAPVHEVDA